MRGGCNGAASGWREETCTLAHPPLSPRRPESPGEGGWHKEPPSTLGVRAPSPGWCGCRVGVFKSPGPPKFFWRSTLMMNYANWPKTMFWGEVF